MAGSAERIAGCTGDRTTDFCRGRRGAEPGCHTVLRIGEDSRERSNEHFVDEDEDLVSPAPHGGTGAETALLGGIFNPRADRIEVLQRFAGKGAGPPAVGE